MAEEYRKQISSLEKSLDNVQTRGDWDDLIIQGTKLRKNLLKFGALVQEVASLHGNTRVKKIPQKRKPKASSLLEFLKNTPKDSNNISKESYRWQVKDADCAILK